MAQVGLRRGIDPLPSPEHAASGGREFRIGERAILRGTVVGITSEVRRLRRGRVVERQAWIAYDVDIGGARVRLAFPHPRSRAVRRLLVPAAILAVVAALASLVLLPVEVNLLLAGGLGGLSALAFERVDWRDLRTWRRSAGPGAVIAQARPEIGDEVLVDGFVVAVDRTAGCLRYRVELVGGDDGGIVVASDAREFVGSTDMSDTSSSTDGVLGRAG